MPDPTGYATLAQAKAAIGDRVERMVAGNDQASIDAQIEYQLLAASGRMDLAIGAVYPLPLDTTTIADANVRGRCEAFLASVCVALVGDTILPGTDDQPGGFTAAAKAARDWLDKVSNYQSRIPGMSAPIVPTFAFIEEAQPTFQTIVPFSPDLYEIARNIGCFTW